VPTVAGVVFTSSILNVDANGAPNSYRVDGNGLSYTCDGVVGIVNGKPVTPGRPNWQKVCQKAWSTAIKSGDYSNVDIFGFEKGEHGKPVVQGAGDPLPGEAYVSTTSMPVASTPNKTQRHYVDATAIPYIMLTQDFAKANRIAFGDVAVVYRPRNGRIAYECSPIQVRL
jgi:hypothetical protein